MLSVISIHFKFVLEFVMVSLLGLVYTSLIEPEQKLHRKVQAEVPWLWEHWAVDGDTATI